MTQLDAGATFAGLRVEGVIGRGSMGIVYRARDEALERDVALKVIAQHLAEDPDFRERFMREARLAATVEHPGIVPIYATGEADGTPYLAMRLVQGESLADRISRQGRLAPTEAIDLLRPIAGALDAAARLGVLHRDIKPANILIPSDGSGAVLIDFGIGRALDSTRATQTGGWLGTVDYLAPERVREDSAGPASDQYALACVIFEALNGRPPYQKDDIVKTLFAHANEPVPATRTTDPALDAAIGSALGIGLAKDPGERFGSCTALLTAIESSIENPGAAVAPASSSPAPEDQAVAPTAADGEAQGPPNASRPRSGALVAAGIGAVVVALLAIAAVTILRSGSGNEGPVAQPVEAMTAETTADTTAASDPEPETQPVPVTREKVALAQYLTPPSPPYRCVAPGLMDHDGNADYIPEFPNGQQITYSTRAGERKDFMLCGGSTARDRPGYASGTITIAAPMLSERVVSVSGIFGRDFDGGAGRGGTVTLTVLYGNRAVCRYSTDDLGHAMRFRCSDFPTPSDLSQVRFRFKVVPDDRYGQFVGIGQPSAVVEVAT